MTSKYTTPSEMVFYSALRIYFPPSPCSVTHLLMLFVLHRFMWTLYTKDPEHWVPIETVASFKRMREYKPQGLDWVVKALGLSEELEVDEGGTKVRRRTEVQQPKGQFDRSVYAVRSSSVCLVVVVAPILMRWDFDRKVSRMKTRLCKASWRRSSTSMGRRMRCA